MNKIQIGDKVTFDTLMVEKFTSETSGQNPELIKYQKLVLAGLNQSGIVKEFNENLATVAFEDGWNLPIPTKYLVLLSQ